MSQRQIHITRTALSRLRVRHQHVSTSAPTRGAPASRRDCPQRLLQLRRALAGSGSDISNTSARSLARSRNSGFRSLLSGAVGHSSSSEADPSRRGEAESEQWEGRG
eukprot:3189060-Rhodomonas_salina.2